MGYCVEMSGKIALLPEFGESRELDKGDPGRFVLDLKVLVLAFRGESTMYAR